MAWAKKLYAVWNYKNFVHLKEWMKWTKWSAAKQTQCFRHTERRVGIGKMYTDESLNSTRIDLTNPILANYVFRTSTHWLLFLTLLRSDTLQHNHNILHLYILVRISIQDIAIDTSVGADKTYRLPHKLRFSPCLNFHFWIEIRVNFTCLLDNSAVLNILHVSYAHKPIQLLNLLTQIDRSLLLF